MRRRFISSNPGGLVRLRDCYLKGQMTEESYLEYRSLLIGTNIYTGVRK